MASLTPSWRPQLTVVVTALLTVMVPATLALTYLANQNLDTHRYELENALREQNRRNLLVLDQQIDATLERIEADILRQLSTAPKDEVILRAVAYQDRKGALAMVDFLKPDGELAPLYEPPGPSWLRRMERPRTRTEWDAVTRAADLSNRSGRATEAVGYERLLADSRPISVPSCPPPRFPTGLAPPHIHLLGVLLQLRSALFAGDQTASASRCRHLLTSHLGDAPPKLASSPAPPDSAPPDSAPPDSASPDSAPPDSAPPDSTHSGSDAVDQAVVSPPPPSITRQRQPLPELLTTWYAITGSSAKLEELKVRLRDVQEAPPGSAAAARQALIEFLGWRDRLEQVRRADIWRRGAAVLCQSEDLSAEPNRFLRRADPDVALIGVARWSESSDRFVTYRLERKRWWAELDQLLASLPENTAVELVDITGRRLAGTTPARFGNSDLVQSHSLTSVPGWTLNLGPRDPTRLTSAAEQWATLSLALTALVLVSVCSGVALLLVNYVRMMRLARMQADFVSGVSHELKTPLALVQMSAETLLMGRYRTAEQARHLQRRIVLETERLSQMVNRVLDFNRLDKGLWPLKLSAVDLPKLIYEVLEQYRPQWEDASATMVVEPPLIAVRLARDPEAEPTALAESPSKVRRSFWAASDAVSNSLPPVWADAEAIRQVLINLLDNALKYCDGKPHITLSAKRIGSGIQLSISDRGIGMSRDVRRRLFDKFFRSSDPAVQRHRGTGLGLSIVRNLIRLQRGDITVDSTPGQGTTFHILLPIPEDWPTDSTLNRVLAPPSPQSTSAAETTSPPPASEVCPK